ncbi:CBASS cGAMP synthase [Tabrizicola sp.]|uniref:CBASS cGAMP synthase n=1 Tax=Tabrizicola sp. TaxID=2005166 RepID=UPI003F29FD16
MANVSKLLYSTVEDECFLDNIDPDDTPLKRARTKIRARLRTAFAASSATLFGRVIRPRFFTQGSCAYGTLNDPAWPPQQQKDLDDGCYLPMSFLKGEKPSTAADLFFKFIDGVLVELASEEGWKHVKKPTCSRVEISRDSHIDIPLYAIPDSEFILLEDRAAATLNSRSELAKASRDVWEALPPDSVLLAHREDDWMESDPRKIHDWFVRAIEIYGERLRRDCRYLKAWRDHHRLDDHHLSSILLMACVWNAYEVIRGPFLPDREDERFLRVVERLPGLLGKAVANPACKDEDLNRMSAEERKHVVTAAENLADRIRETVKGCDDRQRAVQLMQAILGTRVPDRADLVTVGPAAVATVMAQPRAQVPQPLVGRSQSG